MTRRRYSRPGRPLGPSAARTQRPWDPTHLTAEDRCALQYVVANPSHPRWMIAEHLGMGQSRLSVLTCCPLGQAYLETLRHLPLGAHNGY